MQGNIDNRVLLLYQDNNEDCLNQISNIVKQYNYIVTLLKVPNDQDDFLKQINDTNYLIVIVSNTFEEKILREKPAFTHSFRTLILNACQQLGEEKSIFFSLCENESFFENVKKCNIFNQIVEVESYFKNRKNKKNVVKDKSKTVKDFNDFSNGQNVHDYIVKNCFSNNSYILVNKNNIVTLNKRLILSELMSYFISYPFDSSHGTPTKGSNFISDLCQNIINSDALWPVYIDGCAGSGKSLLLTLIYFELYRLSQKESIIPLYIDLRHYEKDSIIGNDDFVEKKVRELDSILEKNLNRKMIILIDGFNYENDQKAFSKLEKFRDNKRIIGIGISSLTNTKPKVKQIRPEIRISIKRIKSQDEKLPRIIKLYLQAISQNRGHDLDNNVGLILDAIRNYNFTEIDFFLLGFLYKDILEKNTTYVKFLKEQHEASTIIEENIDTPKIAFDLFMKKHNTSPNSTHSKTEWSLIFSHDLIWMYLIAQYIIDLILKSANINALKTIDVNNFNHVYPSELNHLIKSLMVTDNNMEVTLFEGIINIWNRIDELDNKEEYFVAKTHLTYILGRLKSAVPKRKAVDFLINIYNSNQFNNILEELNRDIQTVEEYAGIEKISRRKILYIRGVHISLIYLGKIEYSEKYIHLCMKYPFHDNLNRGFHLEYYGDIQFHYSDDDNLTNMDDDTCSIDKTFSILFSKLNEAKESFNQIIYKKHPMYQIELYTLCSLLSHRYFSQVNNITIKNSILKLGSLVNDILKFEIINDEEIYCYFNFFVKIINSKNNLTPEGLYNLVYYLKNRPRRGWVCKGKIDINTVERVSSHVFGSENIAHFFLPERIPEDTKYDKFRIIRMLHFHDLGEAFIGDYMKGEKTEKEKKEERLWIQLISNFGSLKIFSNTAIIRELYAEFENKESTNAKYANDCDLLDCFLQLKNYQLHTEINDDVYMEFLQTTRKGLKTPWGHNMMQMFEKIDKNQIRIEEAYLQNYSPDYY